MNTNTQLSGSTLVIGGTGKTGKRVIQGLRKRDVQVRLGSRTAELAFDWEDQSTWHTALKGIDSVYLTYYPDLAVPKAPSDITEFCKVALQYGVQHIVLLSGRGEAAAQQCEDIVKASGIAWTIIRASWFNQNFSEGAFCDMVEAGVLALPISDVVEPFVDIDDIADVAIEALTVDGHKNKFIPISIDAFKNEMIKQNTPADMIDMLLFLFGEVLDGRNSYLSHGIEDALGRAPKDFSEFVKTL